MVLILCLNPTIQKTLLLDRLAPDEVNRAAQSFWCASGKGVNAARALTQLGGEHLHLTHAGGRFRDWFLSMAAADGVRLAAPDSGSEIRFCHTLLDRGSGGVTEIVEEGSDVQEGTADAVAREFECAMERCGTLLVTGTKAGGYGPAFYPSLVARAKELGKKVVLDVRGNDLLLSLPHRPDAIKPNFAEFAATFFPGDPADDRLLPSVREKMLSLAREHGTAPVVTRGSGPTLAVVEGELREFPVARAEPLNTTGCGDVFAAAFALALDCGQPVETGIAWARDAAARSATTIKPGALFAGV